MEFGELFRIAGTAARLRKMPHDVQGRGVNDQVDSVTGQTLATKLRSLRTDTWADRRVRQQELARALHVSNSTISEWESARAGTPTPSRESLYKIATFFSTRRTLVPSGGEGQPPRLVTDLTDAEAAGRDQLFAELESLRVGDHPTPQQNLLKFSPEEWIRIIGGKLPPEFRNADNDPTSPQHVNHIRMLDYGDLDSIVEMHGHIRALNPASDVEIRQPTDLDEANSHLVLIGNLSRHKWVNSRLEVDLRIRQPRDESDPNGESFEYVDDDGNHHRRGAQIESGSDGNPVVEDVGFLARIPNPINSRFTMTIFSGVLSRGVYGIVRALTDLRFAASNHAYLAENFSDARSFGLLIRVPVLNEKVPTPEFRNEGCVIFKYDDSAEGEP